MNKEGRNAFVLKISPGGEDRVPDALQDDQLIIGWAKAEGLDNPGLDWEAFREIVSNTYHPDEDDYKKAGAAAGNLWRFIRDCQEDDWVVVPYGPEFYVAEVTGPVTYDKARVDDDSAYRRNARWLNDKRSMPRNMARSALVARMKARQTCVNATDLIPLIDECLKLAESGDKPAFHRDLRESLVEATLKEIRSGRMESHGFERLVSDVLKRLGAVEARVVARNQDKGADILATYEIANVFQQEVAVQAKHWKPEPPAGRDVVEQLIRGMEAEAVDLGMVVTSGTISEEAEQCAVKYSEERGTRIELVDGEQLAGLIVDHGIRMI